MKILKYALLALLLIFLLLFFMAPKEMKVSKSTTINAPASLVFDQLKSLKNMDKWSPWNEMDPNAKKTYEGTDGAVGSINTWEGNENMGSGSQSITKIDEGKRVESSLDFIKPFKSHADVSLTMEPDGQSQKVIWEMVSKLPFPGNIFAWLGGAEKQVGQSFEKGLGMLKAQVEAQALELAKKPANNFSISEIPGSEKYYVGKRSTVKLADIANYFGANFGSAMEALGKAKIMPSGAPSGLFYTFDQTKGVTDMAAVIPVATAPATKVGELETFKVKANKWLTMDYYGDYAKTEQAHNAFDEFIKKNNLKQVAPVIEEYITDPMEVKDTAKWLTKIYYPVQ